MTISEIILYGYGVVSTSVAVLTYKAMKRRDKDAVMTQQNNDITTIKVDMGTVKTRLDYTSTKEDVANVRTDVASTKEDVANVRTDVAVVRAELAELKAEILNALKNDRQP